MGGPTIRTQAVPRWPACTRTIPDHRGEAPGSSRSRAVPLSAGRARAVLCFAGVRGEVTAEHLPGTMNGDGLRLGSNPVDNAHCMPEE